VSPQAYQQGFDPFTSRIRSASVTADVEFQKILIVKKNGEKLGEYREEMG
jgi:hypothetical protein